MLEYIGIALIFLGLLFLLSMIMLSKEKDFFKIAFINTIVFFIYISISEYFAEYFTSNDLFGIGKLVFVFSCLTVQVFYGVYLAISRHQKRKNVQKIKRPFLKTKKDLSISLKLFFKQTAENTTDISVF